MIKHFKKIPSIGWSILIAISFFYRAVPLRTVLHLAFKPGAALAQNMDGPDYFEFARPCPPYCKDSIQ